jgi:hypothetical protein
MAAPVSEETGLQGSLGLEEIAKILGLGTQGSPRRDPFEDFQVQSNACGARESQDSTQANDRRPEAAVRQDMVPTSSIHQKTQSCMGAFRREDHKQAA